MKKANPAKLYLMRYRAAKAKAAALERAIAQARELATNTTVPLKEVSVQTSSGGEMLANAVIKMVDAEAILTQMQAETRRTMYDVMQAISAVKDQTQQVVLIEKYINGQTLEEIKDRIHYESRMTQIIHGRALWAVQKYLRENGIEVETRGKPE